MREGLGSLSLGCEFVDIQWMIVKQRVWKNDLWCNMVGGIWTGSCFSVLGLDEAAE